MANRILSFYQDPIQKRLQDNPLEVFLDISMMSLQYTTYTYKQSGEQIKTCDTVLGVELRKPLSAVLLDNPHSPYGFDDGSNFALKLYKSEETTEYYSYRKAHPDSYKLLRLVNVNAIKNSLNNIFTWTPGERVLLPEFGSNLKKLLYEGITTYNVEQIIAEIKHVVQKWEPRVEVTNIVDVSTVDDHENNTVHIKVIYVIPGLSDALFEYEYVHQANTVL